MNHVIGENMFARQYVDGLELRCSELLAEIELLKAEIARLKEDNRRVIEDNQSGDGRQAGMVE